MSTAAWIVVAIIVVVVIVLVAAAIMTSRRRKVESRREEAQDLRERASSQHATVQRREAEAAEADARARAAQAEADATAARAQQMQLDAQQRAEHARASRGELDDQLRQADDIDPDTPSDGSSQVPDDAAVRGAHRSDDSADDELADREAQPRGADDELRHVDLTSTDQAHGAHSQDRPRGTPAT
jgi:hypothetical protein